VKGKERQSECESSTAKLPHEEMMRGETVKNGEFSDSEESAIDAIVL